jgi:RHS repeat-associated protein
VAEYDGNGNLVAKYHHDGGGLMAMTRNNQSYWYGFEGIGTVRQLMGSQGQVVDAYAFDAWGNELTSPQSQVQNPFKYVGKHGYCLDTKSMLMLLGVRYYNASIGRFVSLDPARDGINYYAYVNNNPVSHIDPEGLIPSWCCTPCNRVRSPSTRVIPIRRNCNVHQLDRKGCKCLHELIEHAREMIRNFCHLREEPPGGYFPSPGTDPCSGSYAVSYCCQQNGQCTGITFHCPLFNNPCPGASDASVGCIQDCIASHEFVHREHCRRWGNAPSPPRSFDRIKSECEAWKKTYECVKEKFMKGNCSKKLPD